MSKLIYKSILLFLIFFSFFTHAVTIENFDAFQQSDNLAIRDIQTGLVWLDFGVNNGESINSVVNGLNGIYSDWRLPTETEVTDFWGRLALVDLAGIFNVWGANKTPAEFSPYLAWGYFIDDYGYLGAAYIKEMPQPLRSLSFNGYYENSVIVLGVEKKIIDVKYDGSNYYLFDLDGAAEISTLLIKKSTVDEPSILGLTILCLFSVLFHLQRKNRETICP